MNDAEKIQISLSVIAKMIKFDQTQPGKETAGLLIGEEKDGIVYVDDVRIGEQSANAVYVEITEQELIQAAIEISERGDGKVIVGWIHTHPGLRAFMSSTDIRTQTLYQSHMPNAIAIVMDPVLFTQTGRLEDLDLKVFRVVNNKAVELPYTFTNTVEFGLRNYIMGNDPVQVHTAESKFKYVIPIPSKDKLKKLKIELASLEQTLSKTDFVALRTWLELVEAMSTGDVNEVPIEVENLMMELSNSIDHIGDTLEDLNQNYIHGKVAKYLIGLFLGMILEFVLFYMFLFK